MNFRFPKANYATHSAPLPDDHFYLPEDDQAGKHIGKGAENHYFFRQRYCGGGREYNTLTASSTVCQVAIPSAPHGLYLATLAACLPSGVKINRTIKLPIH